MKLLFAGLLAVSALAAPTWKQLDGYTFDQYVKDFGMHYSEEQLPVRQATFEKNFQTILAHNNNTASTYKLNVNKFTAFSKEEMNQFKGYNKAAARQRRLQMPVARPMNSSAPLPTSVDWRNKGAVTPVKNQEACGSCWAFASTETIESHVQIASGKLLALSPQQITACTPNPNQCGGTGGCSGAIAELAFDYVAKNGGISTEADYPYTAGGGNTGTCKKEPLAATVSGHVKLTENNLNDLMTAVATIGPISISVDADWGAYDSGVYDGCNKNAIIDHAVQLVGYGEEDGTKYWIVRNSWGEDWGESGYIRLKRFDSSDAYCGTDDQPGNGSGCSGGPASVPVCGMCGILYDTCYPTGAKVVQSEEVA